MNAPDEIVSRVPRAMQVLRHALRTDHAYAWSWASNIAMAAVDDGMEHKAANRAAARFMYSAFGVDVTAFPEYIAIQTYRPKWWLAINRMLGGNWPHD